MSNFVSGVGEPPLALTCSKAPIGDGENTMTPVGLHAPPRPSCASQTVCAVVAVEIDGPQLTIGEETERSAVRRPEGKNRVVGIRQGTRIGAVHGTNPEICFAVTADGSECDVRTVGREHRRTGKVRGQAEAAGRAAG